MPINIWFCVIKGKPLWALKLSLGRWHKTCNINDNTKNYKIMLHCKYVKYSFIIPGLLKVLPFYGNMAEIILHVFIESHYITWRINVFPLYTRIETKYCKRCSCKINVLFFFISVHSRQQHQAYSKDFIASTQTSQHLPTVNITSLNILTFNGLLCLLVVFVSNWENINSLQWRHGDVTSPEQLLLLPVRLPLQHVRQFQTVFAFQNLTEQLEGVLPSRGENLQHPVDPFRSCFLHHFELQGGCKHALPNQSSQDARGRHLLL